MRRAFHVILAVIYAVAIFYLSSTPSPPNPITASNFMKIYQILKAHGLEFLAAPFYLAFKHPDKFAHLLLYFGFGTVLNPAVRSVFGKNPYLCTIVLGCLYAASDEIHQMFVPNRSPSFSDFFADAMGLLLSQVAMVLWVNKSKVKKVFFKW